MPRACSQGLGHIQACHRTSTCWTSSCRSNKAVLWGSRMGMLPEIPCVVPRSASKYSYAKTKTSNELSIISRSMLKQRFDVSSALDCSNSQVMLLVEAPCNTAVCKYLGDLSCFLRGSKLVSKTELQRTAGRTEEKLKHSANMKTDPSKTHKKKQKTEMSREESIMSREESISVTPSQSPQARPLDGATGISEQLEPVWQKDCKKG